MRELPVSYNSHKSGVQRIIEYFKEAQLPVFKFRNISEGFMVKVFADKNKVGENDLTANYAKRVTPISAKTLAMKTLKYH